MQNRYFPLVGFIYIVFSSSLLFSMSTVGDYVEHAINFISPVVMFFVIIALYSKYRNVDIFGDLECKIIAFSYVAITIADYLYPILRYWDQSFSSSHYSLFLIEVGVNAAIAKVIIK